MRLTRQPYPLLAVLLLQTLLSLRIVWSNTASTDEALYLWAGHLEWLHWLRGAPIPNFASYFSGTPVIYPPLGALADSVGGLAAARILSLCFMLVATILVYDSTRRLLPDRTTAVYAAGVFALTGSTEALAYATYDAMALMLIALAAWLAVRASGRHPEPFILLAALVMALANFAKYASALWDPAVIAIAIAASWHAGPWRRLLRASRIAIYWACAVGIALRLAGPAILRGILFTTLARQSSTTTPLSVFSNTFNFIGPVIVLSLLAVVASLRSSARIRFLCVSVAIACWLAPTNQARIDTLTSLHKHVDFGAWFAAIGAGYVIYQATRLQRERSWRIAVAVGVVVPLALIALSVSGDMFRTWPPSATMISKLRPLLRSSNEHYLLADCDVVYYYLHEDVYLGQVATLSGCSWEHAQFSDYAAEIISRRFQVIETDSNNISFQGPGNDQAVWRAIAASGAYRLVYRAREVYHPKDFFEIWELIPRKGGG